MTKCVRSSQPRPSGTHVPAAPTLEFDPMGRMRSII